MSGITEQPDKGDVIRREVTDGTHPEREITLKKIPKLDFVEITPKNTGAIIKGIDKWAQDPRQESDLPNFVKRLIEEKTPNKRAYVALSGDGTVEGFSLVNMGFPLVPEGHNIVSDKVYYEEYSANAPWNRKEITSGEQKIKGVRSRLLAHTLKIAFKEFRITEETPEDRILYYSEPTEEEGKIWDEAVTRFNQPEYRYSKDNPQPSYIEGFEGFAAARYYMYITKRGAIKFLVDQEIRTEGKPLGFDEIHEKSTLKENRFSEKYLEGILDEMTREGHISKKEDRYDVL